MDIQYDSLVRMFTDNLKTLFFPEEWVKLDMELSKTELFALILVERHGEIIMSQLADYINIPMSTATGIIDRMVRNGYLKRERSEHDRRIVAIQLADKGRLYTAEFKKIVSRYISGVMEVLTEEEKATMFRVFAKVTDSLRKINQDTGAGVQNSAEVKSIMIE